MKPLIDRLPQPTPEDIRQAREQAGLTQKQAAELVSTAQTAGYKTWAGYETTEGINRREIPRGIWELFLLLTDQHPFLKLSRKR